MNMSALLSILSYRFIQLPLLVFSLYVYRQKVFHNMNNFVVFNCRYSVWVILASPRFQYVVKQLGCLGCDAMQICI
jgi:hypothetical protein